MGRRAAVLLAASSLAASSAPEPPARGLEALFSPGSVSAYAPRRGGAWTITFGDKYLCVDGIKSATVTSITYDVETQPLSLTPFLRTTDASRYPRGSYTQPLISAHGSPRPRTGELRALKGSVVPILDQSVEVTKPCDASYGMADYVEILTRFRVDARGGETSRLTVAYTADGRDGTVEIPYTFIACGTDVPSQNSCRRD